MPYELNPLSVCTVCLHLLANGEWTADEDEALWTGKAMADRWGPDLAHLVPGGDELGFCTSECDGCGDTDHGDRFAATFLRPITSLTCPECLEEARPVRRTDEAIGWGGTLAHLDGSALCPVMTASGYRPADHPDAQG